VASSCPRQPSSGSGVPRLCVPPTYQRYRPPMFHALPAPTDEEIARILEHIHGRVLGLLRRRGRLPEEPSAPDPVAEQMPLLAGYTATSSRNSSPPVLAPATPEKSQAAAIASFSWALRLVIAASKAAAAAGSRARKV
jgi:hypothetical protein